jgi:hypothetical protein
MFSVRVLALVILLSVSGCSIRKHECGVLFDRLKGKGPVLIEPNNDSVASTKFFHETWRSSASIKHLVTQRGAPEAISVEREFLQPNRMRLFYPGQGQVYILDLHEDEWLVSGSEPIVQSDFEKLSRQRAALASGAVHSTVADQRLPMLVKPAPALQAGSLMHAPVSHLAPGEFRGRLKPPGVAAVATLSKQDSRSFVHTVTFTGESLALLADWYTDSEANASRLAAANKRSVLQPLRKGERIQIPSSLMLNPEPLPEAMVP